MRSASFLMARGEVIAQGGLPGEWKTRWAESDIECPYYPPDFAAFLQVVLRPGRRPLVAEGVHCWAWELAPYVEVALALNCPVKVVTVLCSPGRAAQHCATPLITWHWAIQDERLPEHWEHEAIRERVAWRG